MLSLSLFPSQTSADIFRPVLCGRESVQKAAHLHGENHGAVQGHKAPRGAAACVRHHRQCLSVYAPRYVQIETVWQPKNSSQLPLLLFATDRFRSACIILCVTCQLRDI